MYDGIVSCVEHTVFNEVWPCVHELLDFELHLFITKASDVWCLVVPGHSSALLSSTCKFSAMDSMTLIFWLLHSSFTSGCWVVVVLWVVLKGVVVKCALVV